MEYKLRIFIPIFSDSTKGKYFSSHEGNPGIGGTEYNAIILAIYLAKQCPEWLIVLANRTEILLEESLDNLTQEIFENESSFLECIQLDINTLLILTPSFANRVNLRLLQKFENRYICWSHHPFDSKAEKITAKVKASCVVCVGTYQYYSNKRLSPNVHHIQNIFIPPIGSFQDTYRTIDKKKLNIVHLGALIPGKGFLEIAKSWIDLKTSFPEVTLHVIGSSNTYGGKTEHDLIPTSLDYAKQILEYIPKEDIYSGKIIFYGNLGKEKFEIMKKCDLAIQNPTGATEAFPASPLECMSLGVPVIASGDYGMSDCMRFFPELTLVSRNNILSKVYYLTSDSLRYNEICKRSSVVSLWFSSQNNLMILRWINLIKVLAEKNHRDLRLSPVMPFHGSRIKMIARRDVKPVFSKAKKFLLLRAQN